MVLHIGRRRGLGKLMGVGDDWAQQTSRTGFMTGMFSLMGSDLKGCNAGRCRTSRADVLKIREEHLDCNHATTIYEMGSNKELLSYEESKEET